MAKNKKKPKKLAKGYGAYATFLGLVFQMCAIILIGTLAGQWLDNRFLPQSDVPWFTLLMSLLSLALALYVMIAKSWKE